VILYVSRGIQASTKNVHRPVSMTLGRVGRTHKARTYSITLAHDACRSAFRDRVLSLSNDSASESRFPSSVRTVATVVDWYITGISRYFYLDFFFTLRRECSFGEIVTLHSVTPDPSSGDNAQCHPLPSPGEHNDSLCANDRALWMALVVFRVRNVAASV
jgi:hypothetical protein